MESILVISLLFFVFLAGYATCYILSVRPVKSCNQALIDRIIQLTRPAKGGESVSHQFDSTASQ